MKVDAVIDKIRAVCRGESESLTLSKSECEFLNVELSVLRAQEAAWAQENKSIREVAAGLREELQKIRMRQ